MVREPTMQMPFFPANAIMITSLKNLSYYWEIGSARRAVKGEPEFDHIANYESISDAFMVEDTRGFALPGITLTRRAGDRHNYHAQKRDDAPGPSPPPGRIARLPRNST